ncbi:MAG: hypothetical protein ACI8QG_002664, partial [Flavobacteriales bacterium]
HLCQLVYFALGCSQSYKMSYFANVMVFNLIYIVKKGVLIQASHKKT